MRERIRTVLPLHLSIYPTTGTVREGKGRGKQVGSMYIGFSSNPLSSPLSLPLPPLCPIWSVRVHRLSLPSSSLYECERGKITLARFSWGFPPPPPDFHTLGRKGSSLYLRGGGAVTGKANPDSRSPLDHGVCDCD